MLLLEAYKIVILLALQANNELPEGVPKQRNQEAIDIISNVIFNLYKNL